MIKAIFFDIDGTIISTKTHKIPESAIRAIKSVRSLGVLTFLCTSRAIQYLTNIPDIEYDGLVCLTGAHCVDKSGVNINCMRMNPNDVSAIFKDCLNTGSPLMALASDKIYVYKPDHPAVANALAMGGLKASDVLGGFSDFPDFQSDSLISSEFSNLNILQLTAFFPSGVEEQRIMSLMPDSHTERWIEQFVDIIANGTDKSVGIDVMGRHFGFSPAESIAIGDGANDIPMIRHAGVGIAMGNSSEAVKASADFVTDDVDQDGLAKALNHYFNF